MSRFTDLAPETGKTEFADLKYGRANGVEPENGKDYPAEWDEKGVAKNKPIMSVKFIEPRDGTVWKKDGSVKDAKKEIGYSQHYVNHLLQTYIGSKRYLRSNIHVTVGSQRF